MRKMDILYVKKSLTFSLALRLFGLKFIAAFLRTAGMICASKWDEM